MSEVEMADAEFFDSPMADALPADPAATPPAPQREDTPWSEVPPLIPHMTGEKTLPGQGELRFGMAAAQAVPIPEAELPPSPTGTHQGMSDEELSELLQAAIAAMDRAEQQAAREREEGLAPDAVRPWMGRSGPVTSEPEPDLEPVPETLPLLSESESESELSELADAEMVELEALYGMVMAAQEADAMDLDLDTDDEDEEEEEGGDWRDDLSEVSDTPTVFIDVVDNSGMEVLPSIELTGAGEAREESTETVVGLPGPHPDSQALAVVAPSWPKGPRVADGLGTDYLAAALWPRTLEGEGLEEGF
jgi:hypothetical protein